MLFASIHIPNFMVQAAARAEPALRNRAFALVDGTRPIWNVVAVNKSAVSLGVKLGMAKSQAAQFGPVEIRARCPAQEKTAHAALLDLGWSVSPRLEDAAEDTVVLDIAGLTSLWGSPLTIANQLTRRASTLGLIANIAIASNIEAAILASRGFSGVTLIPAGEEAERLGALPVEVLGAPAEILQTLECWGIRTCKSLAALPLLELSERFGQTGVHLHALARGSATRSLVLAEPDLIFEEEMALEHPVTELEPLSFILGRLINQLCSRLSARSMATDSVDLRFHLDSAVQDDAILRNIDSSELRQSTHKNRLSPNVGIYETALNVPVPTRNSKMLLKLLRLKLKSAPPSAPILKVTVTARSASPRSIQRGLFLLSSPDPEKLEVTIACLSNLVGNSNVGSPELIDTHYPGDFRMSPFRPALSQAREKPVHSADSCGAPKPLVVLRLFRPALPAKIELHNGSPAHICFNGMSADVLVTSGPWRTSGNWWREEIWQQDEWDLELMFPFALPRDWRAIPGSAKSSQRAIFRVCYDALRGSWFVRGVYD
jgi:protein ImuB